MKTSTKRNPRSTSFRLSGDALEVLKEISWEDRRSQSSMVEHLIMEYRKKGGKKKPAVVSQ